MGRVCRQSAMDFLVSPLSVSGISSIFVRIRAFFSLHPVMGTTWMTGILWLYTSLVTMIHGRDFPVSDPLVGFRFTSMIMPRCKEVMSATLERPYRLSPAVPHRFHTLSHTDRRFV